MGWHSHPDQPHLGQQINRLLQLRNTFNLNIDQHRALPQKMRRVLRQPAAVRERRKTISSHFLRKKPRFNGCLEK
jgi:hypothetical protein